MIIYAKFFSVNLECLVSLFTHLSVRDQFLIFHRRRSLSSFLYLQHFDVYLHLIYFDDFESIIQLRWIWMNLSNDVVSCSCCYFLEKQLLSTADTLAHERDEWETNLLRCDWREGRGVIWWPTRIINKKARTFLESLSLKVKEITRKMID